MSPAIIRQFLGQSAELIDRVDTDLAHLTRCPQDTLAADRIVGALSALRTSAGFLDLPEFEAAAARAAEIVRELRHSAGLNDANSIASLTTAIQTLKASKAEIQRTVPSHSPAGIAEPQTSTTESAEHENIQQDGAAPAPIVERRPLRLEDSKSALVEHMVEDLRDATAMAEQAVRRAESRVARATGASGLERIGAEMSRTAQFFELPGLHTLADLLIRAGGAIPTMSETGLGQMFPRLHGVLELLREMADGLACSTIIVRPLDGLCDAIRAIADGREMESTNVLPIGCAPLVALEIDGVVARESASEREIAEQIVTDATDAMEMADQERSAEESIAAQLTDVPLHASEPVYAEFTASTTIPCVHEQDFSIMDSAASSSAERVEQEIAAACAAAIPAPGRMDIAMAEVGNLVAQANRLAALPQECSALVEPSRLMTRVSNIASDVARATGDIKSAVLDARALPVGVLLRSCVESAEQGAKNSGRAASTEIHGAQIEIDSGVIERMREPLVRLCAAFGAAASDMESPAITLFASIDEPTDIIEIRVRCATRPGAFDLSNAEIEQLRAAVEAIRGVCTSSIDDAGCVQVTLRVPTNLAFLYCTVVRIGSTLAAIPMSGIDEIVRPDADQIVGSGSSRAVLIRDGAAALLDGYELFGEASEPRGATPYAVIVSHGGKRVALACGRALGAQEIVVRHMDPIPRRLGPISGVGAASDGAATLIVDIPALVRMVDGRANASGELGIAA